MKKLANLIFYILLPWPIYVLLSYHFLGASLRGVMSLVVILLGILSGILANILNWKADREHPNKKRVYAIIFSVISVVYLLSIILINVV